LAQFPLDRPWRLVFTGPDYERLHSHLFPGDRDEHGAVLQAGIAVTTDEVRLLVRQVHLARDGTDYVPSNRGYRKLRAEFILERIAECSDARLVYLAVHNHGGLDRVEFSPPDMASHERGYPALLDILDGLPMGALVFAKNAIAGDIWLPDRRRVPLEQAVAISQGRTVLRPEPLKKPQFVDLQYDRQARLFGDRGQYLLKMAKVGVIGAGGVGSLLTEYLGRLGVGRIVVIDPDRIEPTNLPRVVGATRTDALAWLPSFSRPLWLARLVNRLRRKKVLIAARVIKTANPKAAVSAVFGDVADDDVARQLRDCDYLFLAADTQRARLIFNALVHQYLIPGVQLGAKVPIEERTGIVGDVFTVVRPVRPHIGCLLCNQVINPNKLQEEGQSAEELRAHRYVEDAGVVAPSVITLNATTASYAVNDFLFYLTGLTEKNADEGYLLLFPREREVTFIQPRKGNFCPMCGNSPESLFAMGDGRGLPTRRRRKNRRL
jgi:molybdopterin/thiamine biosynthesis adenylyltransferase